MQQLSTKLWLFAGEPSGDLYGAELARQVWKLAPEMQISGMGGREMDEAGVRILQDNSELAIVGLVEVLRHYPMFRRVFRRLVKLAAEERPDLIVFIDYPGFNLRFAKAMSTLGIDTAWFISPQVWAWGKKRIPVVAKLVRHMMVIFPFEKQIWDDAGLPCTFIGHPLITMLRRETALVERDPNLIVLLPGSRRSEVTRLIGPFIATAVELRRRHPNLRFVLPVPHEKLRPLVQELVDAAMPAEGLPLEIYVGDAPRWMRAAAAGLAASGTVTVQAAILELPLVVAYQVNPISYAIWSRLVSVRFFTMINLIAERVVFEEFLQRDVCPAVLVPAMERILPNGERREQAEAGIAEVINQLDTGTDAAANAAKVILELAACRT